HPRKHREREERGVITRLERDAEEQPGEEEPARRRDHREGRRHRALEEERERGGGGGERERLRRRADEEVRKKARECGDAEVEPLLVVVREPRQRRADVERERADAGEAGGEPAREPEDERIAQAEQLRDREIEEGLEHR